MSESVTDPVLFHDMTDSGRPVAWLVLLQAVPRLVLVAHL